MTKPLLDWNNKPIGVQYRPVTLIGYCYACNQAHSSDEVQRLGEGGKTHCPTCKQALPAEQRLSGQVVYVCKRTGAELFDKDLFHPPIKTEEPIEEEPKPVEEQLESFRGAYLRITTQERESAS